MACTCTERIFNKSSDKQTYFSHGISHCRYVSAVRHPVYSRERERETQSKPDVINRYGKPDKSPSRRYREKKTRENLPFCCFRPIYAAGINGPRFLIPPPHSFYASLFLPLFFWLFRGSWEFFRKVYRSSWNKGNRFYSVRSVDRNVLSSWCDRSIGILSNWFPFWFLSEPSRLSSCKCL